MAGSKIQAFWNHPAGPKTIHFWAPTFKWTISIANVADFSKPPEQLSYPHQAVVAISGLIWSRYSTQIIPTKQVKSNVALVKVFLEEMHGIRQCPYGHKEKEKYLVSNKDYDTTQNGSGVPALHHVHGTMWCGASGHPLRKCGSDLIGATCKSEPSVAWIKSKPCIFTIDGRIAAPYGAVHMVHSRDP